MPDKGLFTGTPGPAERGPSGVYKVFGEGLAKLRCADFIWQQIQVFPIRFPDLLGKPQEGLCHTSSARSAGFVDRFAGEGTHRQGITYVSLIELGNEGCRFDITSGEFPFQFEEGLLVLACLRRAGVGDKDHPIGSLQHRPPCHAACCLAGYGKNLKAHAKVTDATKNGEHVKEGSAILSSRERHARAAMFVGNKTLERI